MADPSKAFYITSVSNGHVLANQANGRPSGVVAENKGDQGNDEKWTIEASDEPNKIALKNAGNGQYLHANGNKCWATVGTGEKQWWRITSDGVTAPGACRLSPAEYPDVSLNHFQGKATRKGAVGIKVHMWTWLPEHESWFTWYFLDANISFNPLTGASAGDKSQAERQEREEKARAQEDQKRSAEWDKKMKELQDRQTSAAEEEKKRTASYDQKIKELQAREDVLNKHEQQAQSSTDNSNKDNKPNDLAQRESDVQRKIDDLNSAEQKLTSDRAALQKSQSDLEKREKDIAQREKELSSESSQSPVSNGPATNGTSASDKSAEQRLEKQRQDNSDLEKRLARLEDQLAKMAEKSDKASDGNAANGKPQANGTANTSAPSKSDANSPGCGFKHYRPPRKLNKKLIGMIYE